MTERLQWLLCFGFAPTIFGMLIHLLSLPMLTSTIVSLSYDSPTFLFCPSVFLVHVHVRGIVPTTTNLHSISYFTSAALLFFILMWVSLLSSAHSSDSTAITLLLDSTRLVGHSTFCLILKYCITLLRGNPSMDFANVIGAGTPVQPQHESSFPILIHVIH